MNVNKSVRDSLASVERSIEIADEILRLCYHSLENEDKSILSQLGVLLGDFSNCLISSLNHYSNAVLTERLTAKMTSKEFEKLSVGFDFPWGQDKTKFDNVPAIKAIKEVSQNLYNAYEYLQPYYTDNEWLDHLMALGNRDQYQVVDRVESLNIASLSAHVSAKGHLEAPKFEGDKLIIPSSDGIITAQLPYYFAPLHAFATQKHTWSQFFVPIQERVNLDLIDFTQVTPIKIVNILSTLDTKFGSDFAALFKDEVENQANSPDLSSS